jgi:hypothetical protein
MQEDALILSSFHPSCIPRKQIGIFDNSFNGQGVGSLTGDCLLGFSIGANLLCSYLGEEGESCELEAAILIGTPWNLEITNTLMVNSTLGLHIYQRALGTAFRNAFER